jgi:hypothetical protein
MEITMLQFRYALLSLAILLASGIAACGWGHSPARGGTHSPAPPAEIDAAVVTMADRLDSEGDATRVQQAIALAGFDQVNRNGTVISGGELSAGRPSHRARSARFDEGNENDNQNHDREREPVCARLSVLERCAKLSSCGSMVSATADDKGVSLRRIVGAIASSRLRCVTGICCPPLH